MKSDKGTAGLTVLLSVVTMIFVIGLLIMIFALMNSEVMDSSIMYDPTSLSVDNETLTTVDDTGEDFSVVNLRNVVCTLTGVWNASDGVAIASANYTQTNCHIANATTTFGGYNWNVSYDYTYDLARESVSVVNDTTTSISGTVDWFPLFIVITAMVVLILLTVIINTTIAVMTMNSGNQST